MLRASALLLIAALACTPSPEKTFVDLADHELQLRQAGSVLQPSAPLKAENDDNAICFELLPGYTRRDDGKIATPAGTVVDIAVEARLESGKVVQLTGSYSYGHDICRAASPQGALGARVVELRIRPTADIEVGRTRWESTSK